ncbi:mucoidy inhibitor MuiA family protein [Pyxidicoccus xibeiensis]|uniref:mucoidy inhibitor MuiA family protein n=1 Tax=Pyxidicoccus xibeiensis TaxID=2906759 RepID=UPI0020A77D8F|nr:mucoidy inhibitor MuiA family protein [Pyxidicoccus xibeiensis]MCP3135811.1 mucoidy inhibitor MuiA family protein [Pyxidicoccus xibeiensis]
MLLLGLGLLASSVLPAATDAPVTSVTVFSDRARVVRTATVTVTGAQRVELPRLRGFVDPASIRVEAQGAEVTHVDVRAVSAQAFSQDSARKLLDRLEQVDEALVRNQAERDAYRAQLEALRRVRPTVRAEDASEQRPPSRTQTSGADPAAWSTAATFLVDTAARLEARLRELEEQSRTLAAERHQQAAKAAELGGAPRQPGVEVAATLSGNGPAKVLLTYFTTGARWYPRYELQLQPESQRVQVAFYGRVSQETGEDWEGAQLALSTALPSTATVLPKLTTWKLGSSERFIPTPLPHDEVFRPAPPAPPLGRPTDPESELRQKLLARAGQPDPTSTPAPSSESSAGQSSQLRGTVIDAQSRQPVPDVVITVTSSAFPGEQTAVTDAQGNYLLPSLPPGVYTLSFEKEDFRMHRRPDIQLRSQRNIRVNVELLPESLGEVAEVVGAPPTIDVGSTTAGVNVDQEFIKRVAVARPGGKGGAARSFESLAEAPTSVGLTPPSAWTRPQVDPRLPAALAGGYDLTFSSQRPETVRSGQGERSIPLVSESWPVQVERKVFPALAPDAFLVARLASPSQRVLPGGEAALFVGADPAGTATLETVVPKQSFTLPLGLDRGVRTARNVRLLQAEKGLLSKDDLGTYEVSIEVPNPYPFPLPVSVVDQWPLNTDGKVEVALLKTEPFAEQDPKKGELQWNLVVPASGKTTVSFQYTLRRPRGWRLYQQH